MSNKSRTMSLRSPSHPQRPISVLVTFTTLLFCSSPCPMAGGVARGVAGVHGISLRSITSVGPPSRPTQFKSLDELNKYLTEVNEYYTVLGRPRFGKRGAADDSRMPPHLISTGDQNLYNDILDSTNFNLPSLSNDNLQPLGRHLKSVHPSIGWFRVVPTGSRLRLKMAHRFADPPTDEIQDHPEDPEEGNSESRDQFRDSDLNEELGQRFGVNADDW